MNKINFEINNLTKRKVDKRLFEKTGKKALRILKIKLSEVSLVLVGDAKIKNLNKKYRKINRVTDVLAFDYGRLLGDLPERHGEIFICLPQAKRQAKKLGHSLKKELAILLIHGILHLAGYDDRIKKDYNKMAKKQEQICQEIIS